MDTGDTFGTSLSTCDRISEEKCQYQVWTGPVSVYRCPGSVRVRFLFFIIIELLATHKLLCNLSVDWIVPVKKREAKVWEWHVRAEVCRTQWCDSELEKWKPVWCNYRSLSPNAEMSLAARVLEKCVVSETTCTNLGPKDTVIDCVFSDSLKLKQITSPGVMPPDCQNVLKRVFFCLHWKQVHLSHHLKLPPPKQDYKNRYNIKFLLTFCVAGMSVCEGVLLFHFHPSIPPPAPPVLRPRSFPRCLRSSIRSLYRSHRGIILFNMVSGRRSLSWQIHYWLALSRTYSCHTQKMTGEKIETIGWGGVEKRTPCPSVVSLSRKSARR